MDKILRTAKKFIPKKIFNLAQPIYHYKLALIGVLIYRFPSRKIKVVAVTGTKGKTSTVELVNAILEEAGKKTALAGTLRFKIGENSKPNLHKMTMPGRFFIQKFLRQAVNQKCEYAIIEISSEAAKQYRNKFVYMNALIFTNLAAEHIESHGSYEKYVAAKVSIAKGLEKSPKKNKAVVVNADDAEAWRFFETKNAEKITFSIKDAEKISLANDEISFFYKGNEIKSPLSGKFNIYNILGAIKYAESEGIDMKIIKSAVEKLRQIKGRAESIKVSENQNFKLIVDYAHTPESLTAIYEAFPGKKIIGVLGSCGGGRDKWKRKAMAEVAEKMCDTVILTDEDPYDDDPKEILEDMARFFKNKKQEIILDRRQAIAKAISYADSEKIVIITGKGTDPYIMRANGHKEKWSDAEVSREELKKRF